MTKETILLAGVIALTMSALSWGAKADDELTLRVNDVRGGPSEIVSVVVRSYAPRSVEQGQICLTAADAGASPVPFRVLENVEVRSSEDDVVVSGALLDARTMVVRFYSPSGTINESDSPLAIFDVELSELLEDGQRYTLKVDLDRSFIVDSSGVPVPLEIRDGKLEIRVDD